MRKQFHPILFKEMVKNDNIYVITADLGYKMFDDIQKQFSERFINVGSREQLMIGVAAGLAMSGKIPVCYSITPFLLKRPYEFINLYCNYMSLNIKLLGGGRDAEYLNNGFTHYAHDALDILNNFPHIAVFYPNSHEELESSTKKWIDWDGPSFLSLSR